MATRLAIPGYEPSEAQRLADALRTSTIHTASTLGGRLPHAHEASSMALPTIEDVEIEEQHTEDFLISPSGQQRAAKRAEHRLVSRYRDYMAAKGLAVGRKNYVPAGAIRPIFSDVWIEARQALIEAKNSDDRDAIRHAIGQLYDYRRFHKSSVNLAVLLPLEPRGEHLDSAAKCRDRSSMAR
jgi:hypothetical protein